MIRAGQSRDLGLILSRDACGTGQKRSRVISADGVIGHPGLCGSFGG